MRNRRSGRDIRRLARRGSSLLCLTLLLVSMQPALPARALYDEWQQNKRVAQENLARSQSLNSVLPEEKLLDEQTRGYISVKPFLQHALLLSLASVFATNEFVEEFFNNMSHKLGNMSIDLAKAYFRRVNNSDLIEKIESAASEFAASTMPLVIHKPVITLNGAEVSTFTMNVGQDVAVRTGVSFARAGGNVPTVHAIAHYLHSSILSKVYPSITEIEVLTNLRNAFLATEKRFTTDYIQRQGYSPFLTPLMDHSDFLTWVNTNEDIHFFQPGTITIESTRTVQLTRLNYEPILKVIQQNYPRRFLAEHAGVVDLTAVIAPGPSRYVDGQNQVSVRIYVRDPNQAAVPPPPAPVQHQGAGYWDANCNYIVDGRITDHGVRSNVTHLCTLPGL